MAIDFIPNPGPEHQGIRNRRPDFYIPEEPVVPSEEEALEQDRAKLVAEKAEFEQMKVEEAERQEKVIVHRRSKKSE